MVYSPFILEGLVFVNELLLIHHLLESGGSFADLKKSLVDVCCWCEIWRRLRLHLECWEAPMVWCCRRVLGVNIHGFYFIVDGKEFHILVCYWMLWHIYKRSAGLGCIKRGLCWRWITTLECWICVWIGEKFLSGGIIKKVFWNVFFWVFVKVVGPIRYIFWGVVVVGLLNICLERNFL